MVDAVARAGGGAIRWLRLLLVGCILLPLALLAGAAWQDFGKVEMQARERVERTAAIAQEHALKVLEGNDILVGRVLDLLATMNDADIRDREGLLHVRLGEITEGIPQVQSVWAWNRDGHPLVSDREHPVDPKLDISQTEYFQAQRSRNARAFITAPYLSRDGGEVLFDVSRRRVDSADNFAGIVAVSIYPRYFVDFYRQITAGDASMGITLLRADGTVLARLPDTNRVGLRFSPSSTVMQAIAANKFGGATRIRSEADGEDRLLSFRKVGRFPIYIAAGLDWSAVYGQWLRDVAATASFAIPGTLVLAAVAWLALGGARREQAALAALQEEGERREAAETALRQAQKLEALGQLTGGVAHDFNNLLMVIGGNLEAIKGRHGMDSPGPIAAIERAAERGASLTRQLLAFARRQALQPRVIDLHTRLPRLLSLLQPSLRGDILLDVDVPSEVWPVAVDPAEFELALLNVAVNARDAMPNGGRLTIHARNERRQTGERVAITIADSGIGMDEATRDRAFEPFFTTKEVGKGTGLGLSQVYGFAQQSGGTVTLDSAPGRGTRVTIYLPRATERPITHVPAAAEEPTEPAPNGRVLLVEDNDEVADVVTMMLEEIGCRVSRASTAVEAIDRLDGGELADLVLSDVVMPGGLNGIELARALRQHYPRLPVLLTTGYSAAARDAASEGLTILAKPYRRDELERAIREALDNAAEAAAS